MKRKLLIVSAVVLAIAAVITLASCTLFGGGETVVPPTVKDIEILKDTAGYTESKEYLYNKDKGTAMALYAGSDFLLSINYNNKKNYPISYVTVNNERIMAKQFEDGSSKTHTVIKLTVPEDAARGTELTYTIKNIFYNTGSETKRIKFEEGLNTTFAVKVSPTYTLTLDKQNFDYRAEVNKVKSDISTSQVDFGVDMSTVGVMDKNYSEPDGLPEKAGGWVFEGWYTQPNGGGQLVNKNDTYYFWSNITLYAYFTRIFEYEIVTLDEPIVTENATYRSGAVITKDNSRQYPYMYINDTIVDENGVTHIEYPVVKIANSAFMDVNSIREASLGKYVTEIGAYAFDNCNALEKFTFNKGSVLKYIGDYAFQDTKVMALSSAFTLPETVEYIGNFAFRNSGWRITNNNGINESVLHIKPQYKFIGAECFLGTGFNQVVFEPGCHFESQIGEAEASEIEKAGGWREIRPELNRIGAKLFANCPNLEQAEFLADNEESNALNIIPDKCFDANRYSVKQLSVLKFAEGIEFIGNEAFNYQGKITVLIIPASVREIGKSAFYNCTSVSSLTFAEGSKLKILHSRCFGNMQSIDRVEILSTEFEKYGNGPFEGCHRLKSIEFPNLRNSDMIPTGFERNENRDEVLAQHKYSDFLFGTYESGSAEIDPDNGQVTSGYSMPTRIFCDALVMEKLKQSILEAKATYTFKDGQVVNTIAGPSTFNNVVFVHDIKLIKTYVNPGTAQGEKAEVKIGLQEIYGGRNASNKTVIGYSIVYWSERSQNIVLPSKIEGITKDITELAMYAIPTSVIHLTVPSNIVRFEHDALNGCSKLEEVRFENIDTLEYIGDYAFCGTNISSFQGGTSLRVIGEGAFKVCRSLKWVDLSASAIINETTASGNTNRDMYITQFKYDYELEDDDTLIDHNNGMFDGAFQGCSNLEWVYLPKKLQQVNNALFWNCKRLRTLIIECDLKTRPGNPMFNKETDHEAFYVNSKPTTIFDSTAVGTTLTIYVNSDLIDVYQLLFPGAKHDLIGRQPSHP